jgi:hypothetical protein
MENKFGLNIDFDPNDCTSFLEDVGILTKTQEGRKHVRMKHACILLFYVFPDNRNKFLERLFMDRKLCSKPRDILKTFSFFTTTVLKSQNFQYQ